MKKLKPLVIAFVCAAALTASTMLFIACEKSNVHKHCPAFPEHIAAYFPYSMGDTLRFANQHNDTTVLIVFSLQKTKASISKLCKWCDCYCSFYVSAETKNAPYREIQASIIDGTTLPNMWECYVFGHFFYKAADDPNAEFPFGNPIVFEDDSIRVVIVHGEGVVEIHEKQENILWNKTP